MDDPVLSFPSLQNPPSCMEANLLPAGHRSMEAFGMSSGHLHASQGHNRHLEGHSIPHSIPSNIGQGHLGHPHSHSLGPQSQSLSLHNHSSNNMQGSMFLSSFQNQGSNNTANPMEEYMMSGLGMQMKDDGRTEETVASNANAQSPTSESKTLCKVSLPLPSLQNKKLTEEMALQVANFVARKGEKRDIKKQSLMKRLARQAETPEQAEIRKAKDRERKARKRAAERLDFHKAVELREKVKHQRRLSRLAETPEQTVKRRERDRLRNAERRSAVSVLTQMYSDVKTKADESSSATECEAEVLKLYYEYLRVRQQLKEGARILASCTQAAAEAALAHPAEGDSQTDKEESENSRDAIVKEEPAENEFEREAEETSTEGASNADCAEKEAERDDDKGSDDEDSNSSSSSSGSSSRTEIDTQYDPNLIVKKEPIDEALAQMGFYGLPIGQLPPGQALPFMPELNVSILGKGDETEGDEEVEDFRVLENQDQAVIFECGLCCRMFMAISNFQDHVNKHLKVTPYTCCECYQVFSTRYGLRLHLEKVSHETGVACALCDQRFFTVDSLGAHASKHCMRQPRACDIVLAAKKRKSVGEVTKNQQQQGRVEEPRVSPEEVKTACPYCNEMFCKRSLTRHIKTHTGEKPHLCHLCGKGFKEQYDLNIHMKIHEEGRPFKCDKCDKTFIYPSDLRKHKQTHEENGLQVPCIVSGCNKVFPSQETLKKHLAWHLENPHFKKSVEIVEPSVLYCNIQGCKESFTSQMMFRCHVEVHKDEPKCLLCGIKIIDKKVFKQHLQIHETLGDFKQPKDNNVELEEDDGSSNDLETRIFTCPVCNLEFQQLSALHDHMAEHNKWVCHLCGQEKRKRGELLKHLNHHYNKRDCVCEICGNSFVNKQVLKAHYIQHTEDKPYTCSECKATFRYSHGYVQHLRHHSGKRLECKACGKLFLTKQGVDRHIKKTHTHILVNGKVPTQAYEHVVKSEAEIMANGAVSHAVPPWIRQNTGFQKPGGSPNSSGDNTPRDTDHENETQRAGRSHDYKERDSDEDSSTSEEN